MVFSMYELGFWTWIRVTSFPLNHVVILYDSFPVWCEHSVLMDGQNFYLVASQGTSQWDQACIETPKTKMWSQAAFSNQNWDRMECPASDGSEGTWSCTIYFQKIFLTSDDSARKRKNQRPQKSKCPFM